MENQEAPWFLSENVLVAVLLPFVVIHRLIQMAGFWLDDLTQIAEGQEGRSRSLGRIAVLAALSPLIAATRLL